MKTAYPVIMRKGEKYIVVSIPDFNINTQGRDYADAVKMARDAIELIGSDLEESCEPLPPPSDIAAIQKAEERGIITLVEVDLAKYKR